MKKLLLAAFTLGVFALLVIRNGDACSKVLWNLDFSEGQPVKEVNPRNPNHIWSIDTTTFPTWGLWPVHILVAIDHYSRKVVAMTPLEGPNSGWTIDALEQAFEKYGAPKHIIMDQHPNFTGKAFAELLGNWDVKPRHGAVGKKGSP